MTDDLPIAGIRIFELGIVIAAPGTCRQIALFGAKVTKVESRKNPDPVHSGSSWLSVVDYV